MKERMQSFLVVITMLLTMCSSIVFAEDSSPTDLSMIKSQDALRNYALSIAKGGERHVWAESMDWDWPGRVSYTNVVGPYGEAILKELFNVELTYRLVNPNDSIQGYVYVYDGEEYRTLLFYGYASYTPTDLESGLPNYNIWMQSIPLPLRNVSSAEILVLNEDGMTADRLEVRVNRHGQLLFQPWLAGAPNGIMAVRFNDGSLVAYNLSSPSGEVPDSSSDKSANYKIAGHYEITAGEGSPTLKIIETWELPTTFVTTLGDGSVVNFDVLGLVQQDGQTKFERPTSMIIEGNSGDAVTVEMYSDVATPVKFNSAGNYRIRFIWKNFGKPGLIYTVPSHDGGKG